MDIMLERILSLIPKKPNGEYVHGEKAAFAKSIGLTSGNLISDWIAGRSDTYKSYVYVISVKYHVSPEWLTGESDIKNPAPTNEGEIDSEQEELIKILSVLDPAEREQLLAHGRTLVIAHEAKDNDSKSP